MSDFIVFRTGIFRILSSMGLVIFFSACSDAPECTGNSACPQGQMCVQEKCVDKSFVPTRRILCDGGPCPTPPPVYLDAQNSPSNPDATSSSPTDSGTTTGTNDAGSTASGDGSTGSSRDARAGDVGSLPIIDGGPGFDSGIAMPQSLGDEGHVWMSELDGANGRFSTAGARLDDNSSALFSVIRTNYAVAGGTCEVIHRVLTGGSVTGVEAHRIIIDYTNIPHHGGPLELSSPGNDGYFVPVTALPTPPIFSLGRPVEFRIQSNSNFGELRAGSYMVNVPPVPAVTSPVNMGDTFSVSANPTITWNPNPTTPNLEFVAELADQQRAAVLTCRVRDGMGRLQISSAALRQWSLANPTPPVDLQLRYDQVLKQNLPRNGGQAVDTAFRVSRGQTHPLAP